MTETPEEAHKALMEGTVELAEACRKERRPYMYEVLGRDFVVMPDVFSPKYFRDTAFFAKEVPKHAAGGRNKRFLEIGTGTGIVLCSVVLNYPTHAVGTDFYGNSVTNAEINVLLHNIGNYADIRWGSVYHPIGKNEKFDTIFWNVPFGDWDVFGAPPYTMAPAVFDPGHKNLRRFILGAQEHFRNEYSNLLIGYSETLGNRSVLEKLAAEAGFKHLDVVAESGYVRDGNPKRPVKYELFEARLK